MYECALHYSTLVKNSFFLSCFYLLMQERLFLTDITPHKPLTSIFFLLVGLPHLYICSFSFLEDPPSSLKQNQSLILSYYRGVEHNETVETWNLPIALHIHSYKGFPCFYKCQIALKTFPVQMWLYITINMLDIFNDFQVLC